jgi:hypothetical protein
MIIVTPEMQNVISRSEIPSLKKSREICRFKQRASSELLDKTREKKDINTRSSLRRVRFEMNSNNQIIPNVDTSRVELTEEEKKNMWWDAEGIKRKAKLDAKSYQTKLEDEGSSISYNAKFYQAWDLCNLNHGELKNLPLISNVPIRGLEVYIFPELTQSRHYVVRMVLKVQRSLPSKMSPDEQAAVLGSVSKNLTRPSKRLSRLFGIGDAGVWGS